MLGERDRKEVGVEGMLEPPEIVLRPDEAILEAYGVWLGKASLYFALAGELGERKAGELVLVWSLEPVGVMKGAQARGELGRRLVRGNVPWAENGEPGVWGVPEASSTVVCRGVMSNSLFSEMVWYVSMPLKLEYEGHSSSGRLKGDTRRVAECKGEAGRPRGELEKVSITGDECERVMGGALSEEAVERERRCVLG